MTVFALHRGMRSQQWKPVLVIFHLLNGNFPALDRVATDAIRAHFSLVDVGVAVLAILAYIRENGLHVALRAFHFFVHASEWIVCLVVVKLRNGFDGTPCGRRVAVFAGNRERTMRTTSGLPLWGRNRSIGWLPYEEQEPAQNLK